MSRVPRPKIDLLREWVRPYKTVFHILNHSEVYCNRCKKNVKCTQKHNLLMHVNTKVHLNEDGTTFNDDLCEAFAAANIPLTKLRNPKLKAFLEKYTHRNVPDESTLRKSSLMKIYPKIQDTIKRALEEKLLWISVDEMTDNLGRHVVNIVGGALETTGPPQPFLLSTRFFSKINADEITESVYTTLTNVLDTSMDPRKVVLLVTGATPYMLEAGRQLKNVYINLLHVTCLSRVLHRICEFVAEEFVNVDLFISQMKIFFSKSRYTAHYSYCCPNLPLPPQPVSTRWGTWVHTACFYADHFLEIQQTVLTLPDDARSASECKAIVSSDSLFKDLQFIKRNFGVLPVSIAILEKRNNMLSTVLQCVNETLVKLKTINGDFGERLSAKIDSIFEENPDLQKLDQVSCGEDSTLAGFYMYAPVTNCEVERSFSAYKEVYTKKRNQFSADNLAKMLSIYVNRQVFVSDDCS